MEGVLEELSLSLSLSLSQRSAEFPMRLVAEERPLEHPLCLFSSFLRSERALARNLGRWSIVVGHVSLKSASLRIFFFL